MPTTILAEEFAEPAHLFAFEFALFRIQGGILDLETALWSDWSPVRSDAAIRRFRRLIRRVGVQNTIGDPRSWLTAIGWNYDLADSAIDFGWPRWR